MRGQKGTYHNLSQSDLYFLKYAKVGLQTMQLCKILVKFLNETSYENRELSLKVDNILVILFTYHPEVALGLIESMVINQCPGSSSQ